MSNLEDSMEQARLQFRASHDWIRGMYTAARNEDYSSFEGYCCLLLRQIERYVGRLERRMDQDEGG